MKTTFITAGDELIRPEWVQSVNIENIERGSVLITHSGGKQVLACGFDAIEAVMMLKPSALEGRRLQWLKNAWAFHNIIGHPVMQILAWLGLYKPAMWLHDITTPHPRGFK